MAIKIAGNRVLDYDGGSYSLTNIAVGYQALQGQTTGIQNVAVGSQALYSNTNGTDNIGIGYQALYSNTTGTDNIGIGSYAFYSNTAGYSNVGVGNYALNSNTTGIRNTAVGEISLNRNIDGTENTALGYGSLRYNTAGYSNTAAGNNSLNSNTTGYLNTAVGANALNKNTTGIYNVAVGWCSLLNNTVGTYNSAFGNEALSINSTGSYNTAIGYQSLKFNITGNYNAAVGHQALYFNTTARFGIAFGYQALYTNTSGEQNTAFGYTALRSNSTGYSNTAIGYEALYSNTTGSYNIGIGFQALYTNTTGENNVAIGRSALNKNTVGTDNTALGANALLFNTTGATNTAVGSNSSFSTTTAIGNAAFGGYSLYTNTTGYSNTAIGTEAMYFNSTGILNTAVGYRALYINSTGTNNTAIGYQSMYLNDTGLSNTALGYQSLKSNTTGNYNSAVGVNALRDNTVGIYNTALGISALLVNTTGEYNTAVGGAALQSNTTGYENIAVGYSALLSNTTGYDNSAVGFQALRNNTTGINNVGVGYQALYTNTVGTSQTAVGNYALTANTTGTFNTGVGYYALRSNTIGTTLTAVGYYSLQANTTGINNTAVGGSALFTNSTGVSNSAFGHEALRSNTTASGNSGFGAGALYSNSTGYNNIAFGQNSLYTNSTGPNNTALGTSSMYSNTTGEENVAVGGFSFYANTTGNKNTAVGTYSMNANTTGTNNTAVGHYASKSNTTGSYNVAVGSSALYDATTGTNNTAIGYNTGRGITTGGKNTIIGANVTGLSSSLSNTVILADGDGNQRLYIDANGNAGIGNTAPTHTLSVTGTLNVSGNANVGNIGATRGVFTNISGTLETAAQTNVTSLGTLSTLTVSGNTFLATSSGNVGVGTSSPSSPTGFARNLTVSDGTSSSVAVKGAASTVAEFAISSTGGWIGTYSNDPMRFATNNSEKMRIDSSGNVGIGTTSPASLLHVRKSGSGDILRLACGAGGAGDGPALMFFDADTSNAAQISTSKSAANTASLLFATANGGSPAERMRIDSSGNVGITSGAKLCLAGTTVTSNHFLKFDSTANGVQIDSYASTIFTNGASSLERMRIDSSGNVGIGTTSPFSKTTISKAVTNTVTTLDSTNTAHLTLAGTDALVRLQFGCGGASLGSYGAFIQAYYDNTTTSGGNGIEALLLNPIGGNVGIGTTSLPASKLTIYDSNKVIDSIGNFSVFTTNSQAADLGGSIGLGGANGSAGAFDPWAFAAIKGAKENSTSSNFAGYLAFATTTSGGTIAERMRIDSSGKLLIGTTTASTNSLITIVGGGLRIGGTTNTDATLHISTSYGGFDRLTQIHPTGASKPALNLMASNDASSNNQWWVWGIDANVWKIHSGTSFSATPAFSITSGSYVGINSSSAATYLDISHPGNVTFGVVARLHQTAIGNSDGPKLEFRKTMTSTKSWAVGILNGVDVGTFSINEDAGTSGFGTSRLSISAGGNVNIGSLGVAIDSNKHFYPGNQTTNAFTWDGFGIQKTGSGYFYVSSGIFYVQSSIQARGGLYNDAATYLQINGGTSGHTYFNGSVGIGTSSPSQKLHVVGGTQLVDNTGANGGQLLYLGQTTAAGTSYGAIASVTGAAAYNTGLYVSVTSATNNNTGLRIVNPPSGVNNYAIYSDAAAQSYFAGNVGIGTPSPIGKLHLAGSALSITGIYQDGSDRPSVGLTGNYPQLVLMSQVANSSHGPTLMLGSKNSGDTNHKHWSIGTSGQDSTFLDIGYHAGNDINPHAGIRNYQGSTWMTILSNGAVGIGEINPGYKLHVAGTIYSSGDHIINNGAPTIYFQDTDHRSAMIHCNGNLLYFLRGSGTNSTGWTLVNGAWPLYLNLETNDAIFGGLVKAEGTYGRFATGYDSGQINSMSCSNWFRSSGSTGWYNETHGGGIYMTDSTYVRVYNSKSLQVDASGYFTVSLGVGTTPSGTTGEIRATNNITAYYSDQRLKENIRLITNPLEKVSKISGVTFTQNSLAETFGYNDYSQQVGVIAQEIQAVLPEAVTQAPFDIAEDGTSKSGENYLTVRYEKLVPLLIEAIKELSAKVKELENK